MAWKTSYYHFDAVGSTRGVTDADQDFLATYPRLAFGEELVETSTVENPFRFVGQEGYYFDEELGTFNVRQRVYDPSTARWMSQDPARSDDSLYRYVTNNPLLNVDPSGLSPKRRVIGWVVRRVGGKFIKVSAIFTEKDAARMFVGKTAVYGFDILVRDGSRQALRVARIIEARVGKAALGRVLKHEGHPIRNLLREAIGTGAPHIQFDRVRGRHIFYGALAAALTHSATSTAQAGDYSLDLTEIYNNPYPGQSIANALTITYWSGEESWFSVLDWVNPGELIAMGADFGRSGDREREKKLLGFAITVRDENQNPLISILLDTSGQPISQTPWKGGVAGTPLPLDSD